MSLSDLEKLLHDSAKRAASPKSSSFLNLALPDGWLYLNEFYVEKKFDLHDGEKLPPKDSDLLKFFGGTMPLYFQFALTSSVPRREYVGELLKKINDAVNGNRCYINLLLGEGGEGKSTILQQIAIDLVKQSSPKIHVLFCENGTVPLETSLIDQLLEYKKPGEDEKFNIIIICDEAHNIAENLFTCAKTAKQTHWARNKIQFLLASRGTYWQWKAPANYKWSRIFSEDFGKIPVNRLSENDAKKIVKAWEEADAITDNLQKMTFDERWSSLHNAAFDKLSSENSFYSAIFDIRKGETLPAYIQNTLDKFKEKSVLNGNLKDYFAYIVALHARGIRLLTKPILKRALSLRDNQNYTDEQINDEILKPLAEGNVGEAQVTEGRYILARHDVVAEQVKCYMEEVSPEIFYTIIAHLAVAAELDFLDYKNSFLKRDEGKENDIRRWNDLADEFFGRGEKDLALYIAEAVSRAIPSDTIAFNLWIDLLRKKANSDRIAGNSDEAERNLNAAANAFAEFLPTMGFYANYFTMWGLIQGLRKKDFLNIWLTAVAFSDKCREVETHSAPPAVRLNSLSKPLKRFFLKTDDRKNTSFYSQENSEIIRKAIEGVAFIAFDPRAESGNTGNFDVSISRGDLEETLKQIKGTIGNIKGKDTNEKLKESFDWMIKGINLAWRFRHNDTGNLPETLPDVPDLSFDKLKNVFGIKTSTPENRL